MKKEKSGIQFEQSIVITFDYGLDDIKPVQVLAFKLIELLSVTDVGIYDGHQMEENFRIGSLYFYGDDAAKLFETVRPILETVSFLKGSTARLNLNNSKSILVEILIGDNSIDNGIDKPVKKRRHIDHIPFEEIGGMFDDDGFEIEPALIPKPQLCLSCQSNDESGMEELLCLMTRHDQKNSEEFICHAYKLKMGW